MSILKSSSRIGCYLCAAAALSLAAPAIATAQKPATQEKPAAQKQERGAGERMGDGWITMKIHSQFITEDALDGSDIDVDTTNNVVTLSGTVATAAGRTRALAIAKATEGVKSVKDNLKIAKDTDAAAGAKEAGRETTGAAKQGGRRVNDGWIKSKVYSQFSTEDALENSDIDVRVKAGVVTLSGTVASAAGRTRAVALAKATEGVKDVKDSLRIAKQ